MLTTIKALCGHCGQESDGAPSAYHLTLFMPARTGYYEFFCKHCYARNRKRADQNIVDLLRSGLVNETLHQMPEEALESHDGPALTPDDALDFCVALDRENDHLCELLAREVPEQCASSTDTDVEVE